MALSPWKRLTQLMLRRRPAEQVQALLSDDRNARDDVIDTSEVAFANPKLDGGDTSELLPVAALADNLLPANEAEAGASVDTEAEFEAASEAPRQDEAPAAEEVAPPEQLVQQLHEGYAKTTRKPRRNPSKAAPPVQDEQDQIPPSQIARSDHTRSSSSDLMALDEEIRLLRDQLSAKLRIQNAQLKRMLKRFEQR